MKVKRTKVNNIPNVAQMINHHEKFSPGIKATQMTEIVHVDPFKIPVNPVHIRAQGDRNASNSISDNTFIIADKSADHLLVQNEMSLNYEQIKSTEEVPLKDGETAKLGPRTVGQSSDSKNITEFQREAMATNRFSFNPAASNNKGNSSSKKQTVNFGYEDFDDELSVKKYPKSDKKQVGDFIGNY